MAGNEGWALEQEVSCHTAAVRCTAWSPDGRGLLTSTFQLNLRALYWIRVRVGVV